MLQYCVPIYAYVFQMALSFRFSEHISVVCISLLSYTVLSILLLPPS